MLLCNLHRSTFSALLPELAVVMQLRPAQMGDIQAAMLGAYLAGQLPAGALADRLGGPRVLLAGLAIWSGATALTALALPGGGGGGGGGGGLGVVYASRVALGLASACAMPCVAAAVAEWAPRQRRAGAVAFVYALFNIGGVLGLILAPQVAQAAGLAAAFLSATGALAALPWLAAAAVGMLSGAAADRLIRAGVPALTVRRRFQTASFLGCAASALPLAASSSPPLWLAVSCLTAHLAAYSASFGGFHAHLQDVAGPSAGVLQGLTNSCSVAAGAAGSVLTGRLLGATGSFAAGFWGLAALYAAAAAVWATATSGEPLGPD
ncbi:MAG: major facilitator superfamily transporter [Monoraphidium minutum]|nr:MAG: major facilitator superfamily transporter [Monoraphidium minutum]